MTTRVLLLIVVHNIFHFSFASVLQGAGNSPILITDYPDATCDGGIVTPSECPVLWNSVSAFDFRVLVANSQAFAQLWCRKAILASGFEDVQRLGQVTTVGLAENSTNRFVFRIPKAPPSFQSVSITTCTITIAVVPYTTYPGDSFVPAFDREFPVSTECNSFTYSRGCACAPPPAAPACAVNFLCDTLLGFPTEPNVCLEQHFTAKGYQAGNSVIIPPVTLQPCVRLTNCPLCNSRPICQWCGSQCINTDFQSCPISPNTTCGARPPPSTAPSSPTTAPPPPPSGQTPAPAVVTPVPIGPESPMSAPPPFDGASSPQTTGTLFIAPTDAPSSNIVAIAAGAGGGAALLLIGGIVALVCWLKHKKARGDKLDEGTVMARYGDAPAAAGSQSYTRPSPPASMYGSASSDYGTGPLARTSDYNLAPPPSSSGGSADYAKAIAPNVLYSNGAFACPQCGKSFPTEGDVMVHKSKRGH